MIYINITGHQASKAHFFERINQQGRRTMVPSYYAELGRWGENIPTYRFAMVRDSSYVVFGHQTDRFGERGECPPSRVCAPYRARVHHGKRNGWCLWLYDSQCLKKRTLTGDSTFVRSEILLHAGPCGSAGCMSVAGGKSGYAQFKTALLDIMEPNEEIIVFVEPRPEEHHTTHLSR